MSPPAAPSIARRPRSTVTCSNISTPRELKEPRPPLCVVHLIDHDHNAKTADRDCARTELIPLLAAHFRRCQLELCRPGTYFGGDDGAAFVFGSAMAGTSSFTLHCWTYESSVIPPFIIAS